MAMGNTLELKEFDQITEDKKRKNLGCKI